MRNGISALTLAIAIASASFAVSQTRGAVSLESQLKRAFPGAAAFSAKQPGPPPHFVAYSDA
jgi:putative Mn2+ efflux pump MntP